MERPVLLAMNNPISDDPRHALYPAPVNCAGWRLWQMFHEAYMRSHSQAAGESVTKRLYTQTFDRRNVLSAREWKAREAREAAQLLLPMLADRTVLVLRAQTADVLRVPRSPLCEWRTAPLPVPAWAQPDLLASEVPEFSGRMAGFRYACAPHPSGRCREYNDPGVRTTVGRTLLEMAQTWWSAEKKETTT